MACSAGAQTLIGSIRCSEGHPHAPVALDMATYVLESTQFAHGLALACGSIAAGADAHGTQTNAAACRFK
jgi:hypothetical protein